MVTERETLAELISDAHVVIKDLKQLTRQCQAAVEILETRARTAVDEEIGAIVKQQLSAYEDSVRTAIDVATASVYERFTQIADILLNETKRAVRDGDTAADQARLVRKIIEERGF